MARIVTWTPDEAKKELTKRLSNALNDRKDLSYRWEENERTLFNTKGVGQTNSNLSYSFDSELGAGDAGVGQSNSSIGTNYSFKNLRLIHAQLSANPPTVVPRPTSNDPEDRRRADAADRMIRFAIREYQMQEQVDKANLNTLIYGTGFIKTMWDTEGGDILEVDEETGDLVMEGRFSVTVPDPWSIYVDPDASTWEDVRYIFEKVMLPYEEACFRFPDKKELFEANRTQGGDKSPGLDGRTSAIDKRYYDVVELYQYWEKGLPTNGYLGRFCWCTKDGQLVTPIDKNPERYGERDSKIKKAVLPFHIFTDIDVPNTVWGKSFIEFGTALQDNLNRLDSVLLENIQAHGVARIILPEGSEIADESITNSPWDVIKITGTQPPHFMEPMPLPQGMTLLREQMKAGIDDISGVNEAMFGQQSREQSGFSMQYATNQGNMIRRRLFNKYVLFVESIYNRYLQVVQKHWDTPRTIKVLGKEKAFETMDIKGADITGGYDIVVEYGASLSLDPTTRREEIMTLMPLFEKAGVEARDILRMLKLNELGGLYDRLELSHDRQREIFEEMIAKNVFIQPEELQDHPNMLSYCYYYVMTTEFKYLDPDSKVLIVNHIKAREQMAASIQQAATGQAPGPAPDPNMAGQLAPVPGSGAPVDLAAMLSGG